MLSHLTWVFFVEGNMMLNHLTQLEKAFYTIEQQSQLAFYFLFERDSLYSAADKAGVDLPSLGYAHTDGLAHTPIALAFPAETAF
jgi:hypothetical protein